VDELPDPLSPNEIARLERVDQATVIAWCRNGRLRAYKVGWLWRVRRDDYLAMRKPNASATTTPAMERRAALSTRERAADTVLDRAGI
jgi:excisionase family DNA binding protein